MASYTEGMDHTPITHHHNNNNNQISFGMMQSPSSPFPATFNINNDGGTYDLGELDQALFSYLDGHDHEDEKQGFGMRPHTLNIFPSQPMHHHAVEPSAAAAAKPNRSGFVSPVTTAGSKRSSDPATNPKKKYALKREGNRRGPSSSSEQDGPKTPDPKTLRRLAQNREAARKSRLRKKAYVQQLESSRVRLAQLEQEIQRARSQGIYVGGNEFAAGDQGLSVSMNNNTSADAAVFDMEYGRWLEEHHRLTVELRSAVEDHLPENELSVFVDNCLAHYDQVISLKSMIAKSDVFHLVSGSWKTPAERCFMWIGGFRPSELIKIIMKQVEPLSEQQVMGICRLQQWMQDAEEGVTQGVDALNQSISETITSHSLSVAPNMNNYMSQMAVAINKLSALQSFVRQADNLRHQTLHRLHQILTTRQAARCFLTLAEYFHRLRALSSLWLARPRQQ